MNRTSKHPDLHEYLERFAIVVCLAGAVAAFIFATT